MDLSTHAGEVSFPGGLREGTEDAVQCALRECEEEVGIPPAEVEILGALPPRTRRQPFFVHEGREVWGLTALFTLALLERLELH